MFILECKEGWFGANCSQKCVGHCKDGFCNHVTGHCDTGCDPGWTGSNCDKGSIIVSFDHQKSNYIA